MPNPSPLRSWPRRGRTRALCMPLPSTASRGPEVGLDLVDRLLVAQVGPFVGVTARDTAPHPVAGRAAPRPDGAAAAVQRPVGGDQRAFDAARGRQGILR